MSWDHNSAPPLLVFLFFGVTLTLFCLAQKRLNMHISVGKTNKGVDHEFAIPPHNHRRC